MKLNLLETKMLPEKMNNYPCPINIFSTNALGQNSVLSYQKKR